MGTTRFPRLKRAATDTNWLAWKRQVPVGVISAVLSYWLLPRFGFNRNFMEQLISIFCFFVAAVFVIPLGEFFYNFFKSGRLIMQDEIGALKSKLEDRDLGIAALTTDLNRIKNESKIYDVLFIITSKDKINNSQGEGIKGMVAQVDIRNNSQHEFYATPQLRFSDTAGTVFVIEGLWADRTLPDVKSKTKEPMLFRAGVRHKLDLALQFAGETAWYAIANASPFKNFRCEEYKLTGTINIMITLVGNMPSITRHFELKEENGILKFDETNFRITNTH